MTNTRGRFIIPIGFLVFFISVVAYFYFSDRGRKELVIPSWTAETGSGKTFYEMSVSRLNFDDPANRIDSSAFISGIAHTGYFSNHVKSDKEYSAGITASWTELKNFYKVREVQFSLCCKTTKTLDDVVMVFEVDDERDSSIYWTSAPIKPVPGNWQFASAYFPVPLIALNPHYRYKSFVWNKSKQEFYVDDLQISFFAMNELASPVLRSARIDFESDSIKEHLDSSMYHGGKKSLRLTGDFQYSPGINHKVSEVAVAPLSQVAIGAWIYPEENDLDAVLVATVKHPDGNQFVWEGRSTDKGVFKKGMWSKHRAQFKLPAATISPDDEISVFVWNKGKTNILVDDFEVVYGEAQSRPGGDPITDMTRQNADTFAFQRNVFPYPTRIYIPEFFRNQVSTTDSGLPSITGQIASGNFIKGSSLSQIVCAENNHLNIYGYCQQKSEMVQVFIGILDFSVSGFPLQIIDLNNDGVQEILLAGKDNRIHRFAIPDLKNTCPGALLKETALQSNTFSFPVGLKPDPTSFEMITTDRDGNHVRELLLIDKKSTRAWEFMIKENTWLPVKWDYNVGNMHINTIFEGSGNSLVCVFSDSLHTLCRSYSWDLNSVTYIENKTTGFLPLNEFGSDTYIQPLVTANRNQSWLKVSRFPRFSVSEFTTDSVGYFYTGSVTFRNVIPGCNPAFYEDVRVLAGNFISSSEISLFAIMENCEETDSSGKICLKHHNQQGIALFKPGNK